LIDLEAGAAPTPHLISELEKKGIKPVHVYGLTETYGPFTRNYEQASLAAMSLEDRARSMARQGHAFATAEEVRVVYVREENEDRPLKDVPRDGKTLGEIVTRGNIVMKEYFRDPEATKKAFRGGSLRSGKIHFVEERWLVGDFDLDAIVARVDLEEDVRWVVCGLW